MTAKPQEPTPGYTEGFADGRMFQSREMIKTLEFARDRLPADPKVIEAVNTIIRVMKEKLTPAELPPKTTVEWNTPQHLT